MAELHARTSLRLRPRSPFAFDASLHKPDHFPSADNAWEPGTRWQTLVWQGVPLGLRLEEAGSVEEPEIAVTVWSVEPLGRSFREEIAAELSHRLSLDLDLKPFYELAARDPHLAEVVRRWHGMRQLNVSSLYEYLVIAIVLQNATVRRSVQMLQALFERYGTPLEYDGRGLHAFWEPATLAAATEEDLRALKLGYRARSLSRVSEAVAGGAVDELELRRQTVEEQRQALLALYGVGPASVGYILTDVFHQLDELSHISPWEQKIYSTLFYETPLEEPVPVSELLQLFERFAPYRGLAVHYVWEDLFWRFRAGEAEWLRPLIRL